VSSVREAVSAALSGEPGDLWQRELAFALAVAMDEQPTASVAKELRALMSELGVSGAISEPKGDVSDDLAAKRAARRSAAASS
jgi:hypothetical protein